MNRRSFFGLVAALFAPKPAATRPVIVIDRTNLAARMAEYQDSLKRYLSLVGYTNSPSDFWQGRFPGVMVETHPEV